MEEEEIKIDIFICDGNHCRCMDPDGTCPNMHWYHCTQCNRNAYKKGAYRPFNREQQIDVPFLSETEKRMERIIGIVKKMSNENKPGDFGAGYSFACDEFIRLIEELRNENTA